jgi:hypothetical protein
VNGRLLAFGVLQFANLPAFFATLILAYYAIAGLWAPHMAWLWPIFLLSPLLHIGLIFAMTGLARKSHWGAAIGLAAAPPLVVGAALLTVFVA